MSDIEFLLGIDAGSTVTKAVVFDRSGHELGKGETRVAHSTPHPRWVERDMEAAWAGAAAAIAESIRSSAVDASRIGAVGLSAHGDALFPVDSAGMPIRPAILSLDSRAYEIIERWRLDGTLDRALPLTGQRPFVSTLPALLTWLDENEAESVARLGWALACKDWLRFRLTGTIGTDRTEASAGFANVQTQAYDDLAFELFGLSSFRDKIPVANEPLRIAGRVSALGSAQTGLIEGTPVNSGCHDVMASAIGAGCIAPGQVAMVAGTWSINEVIADRPATSANWVCRSFVEPGLWVAASWSPASATNLEWFVQELCQDWVTEAKRTGGSAYDFIDDELATIWDETSPVTFHPFLFGSPHGDEASGGLFGLRGWHKRAHLLRAVMEGIAFNHRTHLDDLRTAFTVNEVRLTGGAAHSQRWCQLFADVLQLPVLTTDASEAGARGAAICAGVATGVFASLADGAEQCCRVLARYTPNPDRAAELDERYRVYRRLVDALEPVWPSLG